MESSEDLEWQAVTAPKAPAAPAAPVSPAAPKTFRNVPIGTFKSMDGLKVGVKVEAATASGQKFIGTVTSIGKDEVTVEVESP